MEITCSGMPKTCYPYVTWDDFKVGFKCCGKLKPFHVKGGVKLKEIEFTIREQKIKSFIDKRKKWCYNLTRIIISFLFIIKLERSKKYEF